MYDVKSMKAEEFISDEEIRETLAYADKNCENLELVDVLLKKAEARKGLNHREASVLLACQGRSGSRGCTVWRSRSRKIFTETGS